MRVRDAWVSALVRFRRKSPAVVEPKGVDAAARKRPGSEGLTIGVPSKGWAAPSTAPHRTLVPRLGAESDQVPGPRMPVVVRTSPVSCSSSGLKKLPPLRTVIGAPETLPHSKARSWGRTDMEILLDIIPAEVEGSRPSRSSLVMKVMIGCCAGGRLQAAPGQALNTLYRVDDHKHGVNRCEDPVGIFGKNRCARGVPAG